MTARTTLRRPVIIHDGIFVDAVIGWRYWRLDVEDGVAKLWSYYNHTLWPKGDPIQASCKCSPHNRLLRHGCGIHAWKTGGLLRSTGWVVAGEVALWGDVHEHEWGYRGEYALPVSFNHGDGVRVELAAVQYGVPLIRQEAA